MQLHPLIPFLARRKGIFLPLALAILTFAAPTAALAEDAASAPGADGVDLGTVVVEERTPADAPSRDATAAATVIVPEKAPDPTSTVPSLLEESAGVTVKRYGGMDDFSAISLRGSTAAQVQIYVDDTPLVSASGDLVDLTILPIDSIERIEVYRGGSPGIVPDSTIGGVVLLKTKDRPEKPSFSIRNTGASFTTYRGSVDLAQSFGKVSLIAAYERFQSAGDFKYLDNNGTTFNPSDDTLVTRENNDFASNSLFTKVIIDPDERTRVAFTNAFFQKDQGVPGLGNRQSLTARLQTWRNLVAATADRDFASAPGLSGHLDAFFDFLNDQFNDPNAEISLTPTENDDNTYRAGANARLTYSWGAHQILRLFVASRNEFYLPVNHDATPQDGPHSRRTTINSGLEDELRFIDSDLIIAPSLRLTNVFNDLTNQDPSQPIAFVQKNTRTDNQLSAKVGLKYRIVSDLWFKGNFYRGFRNPTFSELFGNRGTIVGNPTLKPEDAINMDAGLAFHHDFGATVADVEASYYRNSVENLIQYVQTSQFTIRPMNMSSALIQGAELSGRVTWADRLSAYASYTYQQAKDTSDSPATSGKYIPGRPKNEAALGAAWTESWFPWFSSRIFSDLNFMSGNYIDTQNLIEVSRRTLLGVGATATFVKHIALTFSVKNLLDEHIADVVGYPLPGRSYWGTVEVKL